MRYLKRTKSMFPEKTMFTLRLAFAQCTYEKHWHIDENPEKEIEVNLDYEIKRNAHPFDLESQCTSEKSIMDLDIYNRYL